MPGGCAKLSPDIAMCDSLVGQISYSTMTLQDHITVNYDMFKNVRLFASEATSLAITAHAHAYLPFATCPTPTRATHTVTVDL
jgi:hypothetical protein